MASIWKKIIDKGNSLPKEEASASDWEAMHAKIAAHPDLSTPKRRLPYLPMLIGLFLLTLTSVGVFYLWPGSVENNDTLVQPAETALPSSINAQPTEQQMNTSVPDLNKVKQEVPTSEQKVSTKELNKTFPLTTATSRRSAQEIKPESRQKRIVSAVPLPEKSQLASSPTSIAEDKPVPQNSRIEDTSTLNKGSESLQAAQTNTISNAEAKEESSANGVAVSTYDEAEISDTAETVGEPKTQSNKRLEKDKEIKPALDEIEEDVTNKTQQGWEKSEQTEEVPSPNETEEEPSTKFYTRPNQPVEEKKTAQPPVGNTTAFTDNGFRFQAVNVTGQLLTNFQSGFIGYGGGIDADWSRGDWLINTGLYAYQIKYDPFLTGSVDPTGFDSSYVTTFQQRDVFVRVDSAWVVQGPNQGGYVYDTITSTITDSVLVLKIDTAAINRVQQISYVEMPVLLGRRFQFNRYTLDVYGGTILNQLVQTGSGETANRQSLGLDLLLQPSIGYQLSTNWSLKARLGLRYSLLNQDFRKKQLTSSFQFGVGYSW
jgi:hypothetical protein